MEAVYFEKRKGTIFDDPEELFCMRGIYVPEEKVVLFGKQVERYGKYEFYITSDAKTLDMIEEALKGETCADGATYSGIREFECDGSKIRRLVEDYKSENETVRERVRLDISMILDESRN